MTADFWEKTFEHTAHGQCLLALRGGGINGAVEGAAAADGVAMEAGVVAGADEDKGVAGEVWGASDISGGDEGGVETNAGALAGASKGIGVAGNA